VFAFPLQIGAARLGVLDVHRRRPGSLSSESLTRALTFAEVAVQQILDGQARAADGRAADGLAEALAYRHVVYQAQGMVMAQLGCGLVDAMARLRAHAYSLERPLTEVAHEVVAGRLRLEVDRP
jgi:AmiR/NasT family two-component response regulator